MTMDNFNQKYGVYDGVQTYSFMLIEGVSTYNSNYYVGLKREGMAVNDLLYTVSDDDNMTEYYHINGSVSTYIGYEFTHEGILHISNTQFI